MGLIDWTTQQAAEGDLITLYERLVLTFSTEAIYQLTT